MVEENNLFKTLANLNQVSTYSTYTASANALDAFVQENKVTHLVTLRIAVLRNFTFEPLLPVIKGDLALSGLYPEFYINDYDAIARDALDPNSGLYAFKPDFIIMGQWLETLSESIVSRFVSLLPDKVDDEVGRILSTIEDLVVVLRQHSEVPILLNNFPLPAYAALGILDAQTEIYQTQTILRLNLELSHRLSQFRDVYLVDFMSLMARVGSSQGFDERYWHIARSPFGPRALVPFGQEYGKFIRTLRGKSRKCLVLDCDNTLWGGIVGEDGINGIKLGTSYPGSGYKEFQREILNLHDRGVILALCSKNNEADVLEVLRTHPEMLLQESNLATWQINWDDKVTNLQRISTELNIGLDSMVFVDDSEFECGLVREQLPQVAVLHLSSGPSTFKSKLSTGAYFDTLTFSAEDRSRTKMYRDDIQRQNLYQATTSLEDYLANLKLVAEIHPADPIAIARIAQLTQKTNQFNLTTHRYSEGDIQKIVESSKSDVFYLKLQDRIASLGIVGVVILKYVADHAEVDTFLFSCRALGRGAEDALLDYACNAAKSKGCSRIIGDYVLTKKNGQVAEFYRKHNFDLVSENLEGSTWEMALDQQISLTPDWIQVQINQGDSTS